MIVSADNTVMQRYIIDFTVLVSQFSLAAERLYSVLWIKCVQEIYSNKNHSRVNKNHYLMIDIGFCE